MPAATASESPQNGHMEAPRELVELNDGWRFIRSDDLEGAEAITFDDQAWERVAVPHTWQTLADQSNYSHCWYRTHFSVSTDDRSKRIYLRFDGAGIMAEVFLNGVKLGRHVGAYTAFVFDATDQIKHGEDNVLAVRCDNKTDIVGNLSKATGKIFGYYCIAAGLYRPVWLFKTDACHISPLDYGSSGIYVTETNLASGGADVSIKAVLRNTETAAREFVLRHTVRDAADKSVGVLEGRIRLGAGESATQTSAGQLANVTYWTPADPRLYTVRTELLVDGAVRDVVSTRTGFRSIKLQNRQLALNGQPVRLFGAALHSRSERNFHAVRNIEIQRDLEDLKAVGFNSAFFCHYPHPQYSYDLADEMGLMIWAEDGFVNGSYQPEISAGIVREMVRQCYNHPSIFCWSASNEPSETNEAATIALLGVIKAEGDSRRLITFNNATMFNSFSDPQADFVTASVFSGWYPNAGDLWTSRFPYVNQTGGGAVITNQADYRDRYYKISEFEPEGYQLYLGEIVSKRAFEDLDYFLLFWWQMKDVDAANFRGILNSKGLMTFGGYRKDLYYLFQSCLRQDVNVLHICGKHWFLRGTEGNAIKVYSNSKQVTLLVNGVDRGKLTNGKDYSVDGRLIKNVFYWEHALVPGRNEITATDGLNNESCVIYFAPVGKMPVETGSLVTGLSANNGPAWAINRAPEDQWPVYGQFDGNSCNTFAAIPDVLRPSPSTKVTWIVTHRQSLPGANTDLDFGIAPFIRRKAKVWLLITEEREIPAWISQAGFKHTGLTGQWRNDSTFLVDYSLLTKEVGPGEHVALHYGAASTDYAAFVTTNEAAE